jgi:hypothetical protein
MDDDDDGNDRLWIGKEHNALHCITYITQTLVDGRWEGQQHDRIKKVGLVQVLS